uniref:Peptidoglycan-binding protein n=1 Tax=Desulfobacca acetoxidans TaxID=60893 RepID=A0A7V4LDP9_9BACT
MPFYRRGSLGEEVRLIQEKLKGLGLYPGPVDGVFGGGTEAAVRGFQRQQGLEVDGIVGPDTWKRLFPQQGEIPPPQLLTRDLDYRCLALTGSFETGLPVPDCFAGLTGDFDGQGMSFGALQWNFGQGSLQPLLDAMARRHPAVLQDLFGEYHQEFLAVLKAERAEQLDWVRALQDAKFRLREPWRGLFRTLGRRPEFQAIQLEFAQKIFRTALAWCADYGLKSERAVALMYDIRVQNGSISETVKAKIMRDFKHIPQEDEAARLRVIANRRAEAANPTWREDVRARKLTIAEGEGRVHGRCYHLAEQYGLRLAPAVV